MTDTSHDAAHDAAELLRDFVNTLDVETGADEIETPGRLTAWLDEHGLVPGTPSSTASGTASAVASESDLDLARDLREGLRAAMLDHHGPSDPSGPRFPPGLEAALAALPLRITLADGRPRLVPAGAAGAARAGLARITAAIMDAVADGTWTRLKVCQEGTCRWAFLDTSKNRSRSWCSMRVCGNRTKTRAYRARLRTTDQPAGQAAEPAAGAPHRAAGARAAEH